MERRPAAKTAGFFGLLTALLGCPAPAPLAIEPVAAVAPEPHAIERVGPVRVEGGPLPAAVGPAVPAVPGIVRWISEALIALDSGTRENPQWRRTAQGFLDPFGARGSYAFLSASRDLSGLAAAAGVPVFRSGPHQGEHLDLTDTSTFGHYNPAFVAQLACYPDALVASGAVNDALKQAMRRRVRPQLRTYIRAYQHLAADPLWWDSLAQRFQHNALAGGDWMETQVGLFDAAIRSLDVAADTTHSMEMQSAFGFWLRRRIDGTAPLFLTAARRLQMLLDGEPAVGPKLGAPCGQILASVPKLPVPEVQGGVPVAKGLGKTSSVAERPFSQVGQIAFGYTDGRYVLASQAAGDPAALTYAWCGGRPVQRLEFLGRRPGRPGNSHRDIASNLANAAGFAYRLAGARLDRVAMGTRIGELCLLVDEAFRANTRPVGTTTSSVGEVCTAVERRGVGRRQPGRSMERCEVIAGLDDSRVLRAVFAPSGKALLASYFIGGAHPRWIRDVEGQQDPSGVSCWRVDDGCDDFAGPVLKWAFQVDDRRGHYALVFTWGGAEGQSLAAYSNAPNGQFTEHLRGYRYWVPQ